MSADPLLGESRFDAHYGLDQVDCDDSGARAVLHVREHHLQPTGIVHGGVYASIAEAVASVGTNWHVASTGSVALGMSNLTSFLRPVAAGAVHAQGTPLHRGSTTWVWDVQMRDDDGRVCAVSRVTVAVRRRRG